MSREPRPSVKFTVHPKLGPDDSKALKYFLLGMERDRPSYIKEGCTFMYRGSEVVVEGRKK